MSSAFERIATAFVLVAMSIQMAPPVAEAKAPKTPTPPKPPSIDSLSHKAAPTEVPSMRTAYSNTYDNHDGTFTASVSPSPINYRPSANAAFEPIDLTMAAISGGNGRVRASKTPVPVEVGAPDDAAGFVSADTGKGKISLRLAPGAKPGRAGSKPSMSKGRADVSGLLPGVDLRVMAGTDGFRLFLTLASRPATSSFTFTLDAGGLTAALQDDGTISFTDKSGTLIATMPKPFATDSTVDDRRGSGRWTDKLTYALENKGGKTLLTVTVDPAWLASAVYPVYVDPSVATVGAAADTFIANTSRYTNFNSFARPDSPYYHEMLLGPDPGDTSTVYWDLLKFNLPAGVAGTTIDSAYLGVYPYWQYEHYAAVTTWVNKLTTSWSASTVTYATKPGYTGVVASGPSVQGAFSNIDVRTTVQGWANGEANYGFLLHENGNGVTYWKRLISSEQGGGNVPKLSITYSVPTVTAASPANGGWTNGRNVAWTYNGNGGPAQGLYWVDVSTSSSFTSFVAQAVGASGTASTWQIPGLIDGTTYYWRARAFDGHTQSAWSATWSFKYDATPPLFSATKFTTPAPSGGKIDVATLPLVFSWDAAEDAAGTSGVAGYRYELYSAPVDPAHPDQCGTSWSAGAPVVVPATTRSYSPTSSTTPSGYCYKLAVSARDNAGNETSPFETNEFLVDLSQVDAPTVTRDAASDGKSYQSSNGQIFFRGLDSGSLTLKSHGTNNISGIASSHFGTLSVPGDWGYAATTVSGDPATVALAWGPATGSTSMPVTFITNAGVTSPSANVLITADAAAPTVQWVAPVNGATNYQSSTDYAVKWLTRMPALALPPAHSSASVVPL